MKGKFKVLMVYSEVAPFAKTGGLGDVGGALPKALKDMGHDVRVITPQYRMINERKYILRDVIRLQNIDVPLGKKKLKVSVKSAFLPNSKVQVYFIHYKPFFFREGLYSDPKTGQDYPDNAKRFVLFSKAVLETLNKLQWQPDVIHCNDWQTGLIPYLLKTAYKEDSFFKNTHSLFTVHNFAFQGVFDSDCIPLIEDENAPDTGDSVAGQNGQCNFLKTGLEYADIINTVSETYAKEAQTSPKFGCGMEGLLKSRKSDLYGVVNGIDDSVWSPENDSLIPEKYSFDAYEKKALNKQALLEQLGLPVDLDKPVIAVISRLTEQKGLDLIQKAFQEIMKLDVYFILLGLGDPLFHKFFTQMGKKYKKQVSVQLRFDDALAHLIMAGSDIFLMPSRFEPCGLTQLYGLKYGTVPVVHLTGGLADTIQSFNSNTGRGNGFVIKKAETRQVVSTLKEVVKIYKNGNTWNKIIKNGMRQDFSWQTSAKKYLQLYQKCVSKKR